MQAFLKQCLPSFWIPKCCLCMLGTGQSFLRYAKKHLSVLSQLDLLQLQAYPFAESKHAGSKTSVKECVCMAFFFFFLLGVERQKLPCLDNILSDSPFLSCFQWNPFSFTSSVLIQCVPRHTDCVFEEKFWNQMVFELKYFRVKGQQYFVRKIMNVEGFLQPSDKDQSYSIYIVTALFCLH